MGEADAVRRYYTLVDAGDVVALVALFAPDAVYERPGYEPLEGSAAIEAFYRNERVIRDGHHTVEALFTDSPRVATKGRFEGSLRDGRPVSVRFADFWTFQADGRVARRETFFFAPLV
jgi:ketosteroid isomerase-like protein